MGVRRLSTASIKSNNKSSKFSDGQTGTFELIQRTTFSVDTAEVNFNNIPQVYTHLQLRIVATGNYTSATNGYLSMRFNGETGADYTRHDLYVSTSVVGAAAYTGQTVLPIQRLYYNTSGNLTASRMIVDIYDYTSTNKYKTIKAIGGYLLSNDGMISYSSALLAKTAAVSSIKLFEISALKLNKNSTFALYGIRSQ